MKSRPTFLAALLTAVCALCAGREAHAWSLGDLGTELEDARATAEADGGSGALDLDIEGMWDDERSEVAWKAVEQAVAESRLKPKDAHYDETFNEEVNFRGRRYRVLFRISRIDPIADKYTHTRNATGTVQFQLRKYGMKVEALVFDRGKAHKGESKFKLRQSAGGLRHAEQKQIHNALLDIWGGKSGHELISQHGARRIRLAQIACKSHEYGKMCKIRRRPWTVRRKQLAYPKVDSGKYNAYVGANGL